MGEDQLDDLEIDEPITLRILDGSAWDFSQTKMMEVMKDRKVWRLNFELLPPQPSRKSGQWRKKKKEEDSVITFKPAKDSGSNFLNLEAHEDLATFISTSSVLQLW